MTEEARKRFREMLLKELQADGPLEWYIIACGAADRPRGALVRARGPTEAWHLYHGLGLHPGGNTTTIGPIPEEGTAKVPAGNRWRLLTEKEYQDPTAAGKEFAGG